MTTVNYPSPVMVNGYSCKNCTEVDEAKKHIDPRHPKDGPFGVLAQPPNPNDPNQTRGASGAGRSPAVTFGGSLAVAGPTAGTLTAGNSAAASARRDPLQPRQGQRLDITV